MSTRTSPKRFTSSRSRATPSTTRWMASCRCSAAARAEMSGSRSQRGCRSVIAMSTCCAMRWRSIRSTSAASTSEPPAVRCTRRPMPATAGRLSSAISPPWCRWRFKRSRSAGLQPCHFGRPESLHYNLHQMVRVELPQHLRTLAQVGTEISVDIRGQVTQRSVIDAIEARYPMLRGTIRDYATDRRRPFLRFYACEEDLSHELPDVPLPDAVASGDEPYLIIGALAGG